MVVCDFHGKSYSNKYIWVDTDLLRIISVSHQLILFKPLKINKRVVAFSAVIVDCTGAKIMVAKFLN